VTWICHKCRWRYPDDVPTEPAFYEGQTRAFCGLCVNINPNRLTRAAARDYERALLLARAARLSGHAVPPTVEP
jgi:hypothetical protein